MEESKQILTYSKDNFSQDNLDELLEQVPLLLGLVNRKKTFSFVTLEARGEGSYYLTDKTDYFQALDDSLYNLLLLVDELEVAGKKKEAAKVQAVYDKLLRKFD
ncbi:MAG: hypothetical protein LKE40_01575 [Spirochaetia bacterium]|nr:hypothetical protein [Spirochaetia bacterium]